MPGSTPTLRDMVQDAFDRGLTLEQLEARAVDPKTGQRASRALISRLRRGEVDRMPYKHHVRAIAAAIGKPSMAVRDAAIAEWMPEDEFEQAATPSPSALLEEAGRLAVQVVQLTREAERQMATEGKPGERETA
jgi:transcriptional regulator with XRE-family HTH domain